MPSLQQTIQECSSFVKMQQMLVTAKLEQHWWHGRRVTVEGYREAIKPMSLYHRILELAQTEIFHDNIAERMALMNLDCIVVDWIGDDDYYAVVKGPRLRWNTFYEGEWERVFPNVLRPVEYLTCKTYRQQVLAGSAKAETKEYQFDTEDIKRAYAAVYTKSQN